MRGRRITISLPLSADDGPTLNAGLAAAFFQGIPTSIAKEPYIFVNFQGGPDPLSPPLDPHIRKGSWRRSFLLVIIGLYEPP